MPGIPYSPTLEVPDAGAGVSFNRIPARTLAQMAVAVTGALAGAVGAHAVLDDPGVQVAVVNAATGSAGTVLATLAAYLFVRRMHRTLALGDTLLASAVTLLGAVSAVGALVPAAVEDGAASARVVVVMSAGVVVSVGLVASAWGWRRTLGSVRTVDHLYVVALLGGGFTVAATVALLHGLGVSLAAAPPPLAVTGIDILACVCAGIAATVYVREVAKGAEPVVRWLAAAAAIMAVAHLADAVLRSGSMLSGGDLVQVLGWLALLIGGVRDFEWTHRRSAEVAVLDERRRLARELHDGLAQELAYITTETRRLAGHPGAAHLVSAAERALEESRAAILALSRPADEPLERLLGDAARSVAERAGIDVTVAVRPGMDATPEVRQALLRILREAMGNAARHAGAAKVHVSVDGPSPLVMAVADDGTGFDLARPLRPDSLGLVSMRERAENLGGALSIESVPGEGTTVALVLP